MCGISSPFVAAREPAGEPAARDALLPPLLAEARDARARAAPPSPPTYRCRTAIDRTRRRSTARSCARRHRSARRARTSRCGRSARRRPASLRVDRVLNRLRHARAARRRSTSLMPRSHVRDEEPVAAIRRRRRRRGRSPARRRRRRARDSATRRSRSSPIRRRSSSADTVPDRRVEARDARRDSRPRCCERAHDADQPVAAHAEVRLVVEEDDAGQRVGVHGRREQRADDRRVAARLADDASSQMIERCAAGRRAARPSSRRPAAATRRRRRASARLRCANRRREWAVAGGSIMD